MSLNIEAIKKRQPDVNIKALYDRLIERPMSDFLSVAAEVRIGQGLAKLGEGSQVPRLYQRIHFQLIEARQHIKFLESELAEAKRAKG